MGLFSGSINVTIPWMDCWRFTPGLVNLSKPHADARHETTNMASEPLWLHHVYPCLQSLMAGTAQLYLAKNTGKKHHLQSAAEWSMTICNCDFCLLL